MSLISVIVPVFKVEKYIERCLLSVQKQTWHDIEIVIVDDCSPDTSMEIVQVLAKDDCRIKIISHERNMGPMWARRTGYEVATGDYVFFCDSDDYLPPTALEHLYDMAVKSDADIVSGNIMYVSQNGGAALWGNHLKYGNTRESVLKSLLRHELLHNLCGKLFRTSLLQNYDYKTFKNATNGEDACLLYQIVCNMTSMVQVDNIVYYYMQNTESSSQVRRSNSALRSICATNAEIVAVVEPFDCLRKELAANISYTLVDLVYRGYDKDGFLSALYDEFSLTEYFSNGIILRAHTLPNAIKLLLKKYVVRRKTV